MIQLINVRKYYPDQIGLSQTNLNIPKGQRVAILGENGSGKTTLLKAIMGLLSLYEGEILINNEKVTSQYTKLSYITHECSSFHSETPREYAHFLSQFFPSFCFDDYIGLLNSFEIDMNKKISRLTQAQRAKLEISTGLSKGAEYLLMDDPFLGQDLFTIRHSLELLSTHLSKEKTLLIATHHLAEIEDYIDRAIVLKRGHIIGDFAMEDLKSNKKSLSQAVEEITFAHSL